MSDFIVKDIMKIIFLVGGFILAICGAVTAQQSDSKNLTWENKLFETRVTYSTFACKKSERKLVDAYFRDKPLNRNFRMVCHNNCAVLKSFPQKPMPPFDKKLLGTGFIAVHILANEQGIPIFARALNGQSPMRAIFQARACEAAFDSSDTKRHKVLFLCPSSECSIAQPVE